MLQQEIELKNQAAAHRATLPDPVGRKTALAQLDLRQVIAEEARPKFLA